MNALATKFGVNTAALAVAAAATLIPMQAATVQAAPVSQYASEWSQSVGTALSDLAPTQILCVGTVPQCTGPGASVLFSLNLANVLSLVPVVGPLVAQVVAQFNLAGCAFGFCVQTGPYGSMSS
jgi:hypothetical protein